ncbi:hypothetical protein PFISCL1PPCAC_28503, partial [Pristionchus fissidentatus]
TCTPGSDWLQDLYAANDIVTLPPELLHIEHRFQCIVDMSSEADGCCMLLTREGILYSSTNDFNPECHEFKSIKKNLPEDSTIDGFVTILADDSSENECFVVAHNKEYFFLVDPISDTIALKEDAHL